MKTLTGNTYTVIYELFKNISTTKSSDSMHIKTAPKGIGNIVFHIIGTKSVVYICCVRRIKYNSHPMKREYTNISCLENAKFLAHKRQLTEAPNGHLFIWNDRLWCDTWQHLLKYFPLQMLNTNLLIKWNKIIFAYMLYMMDRKFKTIGNWRSKCRRH